MPSFSSITDSSLSERSCVSSFDHKDHEGENSVSQLAENFFDWKTIYSLPTFLKIAAVWIKNSGDQCLRKISSLFYQDSSPLNGKHLYSLLIAEAERTSTQKQSIFREFLKPYLFASYPSSLTSNPSKYDIDLEGPFSLEEEFIFEGRKLRIYVFAKDGDGILGFHVAILDSTLQEIQLSKLILSKKIDCPPAYKIHSGKEWAYPYCHHVQHLNLELTNNHPDIMNTIDYIVELKTMELLSVIHVLGERMSENKIEELKQLLDIVLDIVVCYETALSLDFLTPFRRQQLCTSRALFQEKLLNFMRKAYELLGQNPSALENLNEQELIEATFYLLETASTLCPFEMKA